jgi:hypothetical protein
MAFEVSQGSYGPVSLDGLGFIVLGFTPGAMANGNWSVGLIADERASAEQREAITAIASGEAGGPMAALSGLIGKFLGVQPAPIRFDRTGAKWSVKAADFLDMAAEAPGASTLMPPSRSTSTTPATRPLIASRWRAATRSACMPLVWHGKTSAARTMDSMRRSPGATRSASSLRAPAAAASSSVPSFITSHVARRT